jgi:phage shock protein PspC (stress-responsive transcriptional regulator)
MAKRLYLASGRNAKFLGVCGGIAEYLDVDPTVVRLAWVILTLLSFGLGIVAYLLAYAIIPKR